jgi:hypothetical protein
VIVTTVSANAVLVSVIVRAAVRAAPVFAATENATVPFPAPVAPCVTVRNPALLTAPHVQLLVVLMDIVPVPPAAGKDVVVFPVITLHPFPLADSGLLQATADIRNAARMAGFAAAEGFLDKNERIKTSLHCSEQ